MLQKQTTPQFVTVLLLSVMNVWLTIARWEMTLDHFLDTAFLMFI